MNRDSPGPADPYRAPTCRSLGQAVASPSNGRSHASVVRIKPLRLRGVAGAAVRWKPVP